MASSTTSLNPQAPEYLPLSNETPLTPWIPTTPPFIQPAFPTSPVPFPYRNQPPLHVPEYLSTSNQGQSLYSVTFLPQYTTNCHPLHLTPSPEQADVPPPPALVSWLAVPPTPPPVRMSSLVGTSKPAESVLLPKVVITERNGAAEYRMIKARRGRGGGKGGFRGNYEWLRRGASCMDEEKRADRGRTYVGKYQSLTLRRDEDITTVMIKNIPYQYTPGMLLEFMDKHCMLENQKGNEGRCQEAEQNTLSAYDFLYLPMDFRTKMNKGYAFVNFSEPEAAWKFFSAYDGTKWNFKDSSKIRKIVRARIQGKQALVTHFQKSNFECESDDFLPLCFSPPRDGSGTTVQLTVVGNRRGNSHFFSR